MSNGTWELVDLPEGRQVVDNAWIFKIQSGVDGNGSRYKARFLAKGYSQRAGLEYTVTFSPIIGVACLRLFLAIYVAMDLKLCQLDIDATSSMLLSQRMSTFGNRSLSPLPCQAWHGYMVTSAHRVKVDVAADGYASATPFGAAAVAPPAGADELVLSNS
jgi:hypothetical protein